MHFKYGFSFYPEHCTSQEELNKDYELIKRSGANLVRMAEFAWDRLEPQDGIFDLDWLETVINELGRRGVMTILSTPTACPPAWLYRDHDIAYVNSLGYKKPFGARRHYCPTKPDMLFYAKRITAKLTQRFGKNPYVYGWQIDNELAHNGSGRCRCENCTKEFRLWLRDRFDNDITKLNKAFGTYFWSGTYNNFEQITLPAGNIERGNTNCKYNSFYENPSLRLEFEKFSSEMIKSFMDAQIMIIKAFSDKPITTNSTGLATNTIDYYRLFEKADRYGIDNYPTMFHGNNDYCSVNFSHARGCKPDLPFWVMEYTSGGGHTTSGGGRIQPYPGAIEQNVVYAYAAGASAVLHFQYKSFRAGSEQLNYAILDTDRVPRRRYFEFRHTAEIMKKLEDTIGPAYHKKSKAAIIMSYRDCWAVEIKPLSADQHYIQCLKELYSIMNSLNIAPEIISENAPLDDYDLIITVMPVTMSEDLKERLKAFVKGGGTLLTTVGTAIKDTNNLAADHTFPSDMTDLFGIEVQETEPILERINEMDIRIGDQILSAVRWAEYLKCLTARPVAAVETGYHRGSCIIAKNSFGNGIAYYIGTFLERDGMRHLMKHIANAVGIYAPIEPTDGCDIQVMTDEDDNEYIFVFNYLMENVTVPLRENFYDIINDTDTGKDMTLPPKGYACLLKQYDPSKLTEHNKNDNAKTALRLTANH